MHGTGRKTLPSIRFLIVVCPHRNDFEPPSPATGCTCNGRLYRRSMRLVVRTAQRLASNRNTFGRIGCGGRTLMHAQDFFQRWPKNAVGRASLDVSSNTAHNDGLVKAMATGAKLACEAEGGGGGGGGDLSVGAPVLKTQSSTSPVGICFSRAAFIRLRRAAARQVRPGSAHRAIAHHRLCTATAVSMSVRGAPVLQVALEVLPTATSPHLGADKHGQRGRQRP